MEIINSTYKMNMAEFDKALSILKKEQQANMPTRGQKIFFILLNVAAYGCVLTLISIFVFPNTYLLLLIGVLILMIPILLLMNLPLVVKLFRQSKLVRNLGLSHVINSPWKNECKSKKIYNLFTLIMGLLGILIILFGLYGVLFTGGPLIESNLIAGGILVALGLALISAHIIRRNKERLSVVARLQSSLSDYKNAADKFKENRIDVPSEDIELIAKMDRAQIYRARQESIMESLEDSEQVDFFVLKSRSARDSLSKLNPETRSRILDQIDDLTMNPEPQGVKSDAKMDTLRLRVPETSAEIIYSVDSDSRRIKILTIHMIDDDAALNLKN